MEFHFFCFNVTLDIPYWRINNKTNACLTSHKQNIKFISCNIDPQK
jgi:hypothetical protein